MGFGAFIRFAHGRKCHQIRCDECLRSDMRVSASFGVDVARSALPQTVIITVVIIDQVTRESSRMG